jgi:hypothetical protein
MALILDGTNGLSDVDGSAATPAIRGSDANTGVFFGSDVVGVSTGGTERVRVDASGNLGLGVTPSASWSGVSAMQLGARAAITGTITYSTFSTNAVATTAGWAANYLTDGFAALYAHQVSNGQHQWYTAPSGTAGNAISFTRAMTLDSSGNLLVGTTSSSILTGANASGLQYLAGQNLVTAASSYTPLVVNRSESNTTSYELVAFFRNGAKGGAISGTPTATTYATSSDYRLKHDIQPMTGALAKVAQLKPVTYKWNADDSESQGFIAHELQEVVPECVTGEKDAVDAEGNPKYQGIDTSFLVATLVSAIQELKAELDTVKAEVIALKAKA